MKHKKHPPDAAQALQANLARAGVLTDTERIVAENAALRLLMLQAQIELARRDILVLQQRITEAHPGYTFDLATGTLTGTPLPTP